MFIECCCRKITGNTSLGVLVWQLPRKCFKNSQKISGKWNGTTKMGCIFWCRQLRFDITHEETLKEWLISWRQIPYGRTHAEWDRPPTLWLNHYFITKLSVHYCYGHNTSTGTVRRLFHQKSYYSTAPVRRPAGGRKNRTIFFVNCLCYGHKSSTGTVFHHKSCDSTAPGRRQEESYDILINFLDIVRCPVKYRYYLQFHGSRTAFGKVIECKWHRPGTVRSPDGARPAFAHIGQTPDDFCLKCISYDTVRLISYNAVRAPYGVRPGIGRWYHIQTPAAARTIL